MELKLELELELELRREGGGEVPNEPDESFGGSVFFGFELIDNKCLEVLGLQGRGELAVADLLNVAQHVALYGSECY